MVPHRGCHPRRRCGPQEGMHSSRDIIDSFIWCVRLSSSRRTARLWRHAAKSPFRRRVSFHRSRLFSLVKCDVTHSWRGHQAPARWLAQGRVTLAPRRVCVRERLHGGAPSMVPRQPRREGEMMTQNTHHDQIVKYNFIAAATWLAQGRVANVPRRVCVREHAHSGAPGVGPNRARSALRCVI